jgi:hypothetical protein
MIIQIKNILFYQKIGINAHKIKINAIKKKCLFMPNLFQEKSLQNILLRI